MHRVTPNFTLNHIVEVFRGNLTKASRAKGLEEVELKGCGSQFVKVDAERLVRYLVELGVIEEKTTKSGMGYPVTYANLNERSPNIAKLLNHQHQVVLSFSEKKSSSKNTSASSKTSKRGTLFVLL
jgi:superfamily II DNA helicase RecQ